MAKWKCNEPECGHEWTAKDPANCPVCGSVDFQEVGSSGFPPVWWKKTAIGIAVLIVLIIAFNINGDKIKVNVEFNKKASSIKVELDGFAKQSNKKDFIIILNKDGKEIDRKAGTLKKSFISLMPGTYYIQVKYIGKEAAPEIAYNPSAGPFVIETPPPPPPVELRIIGVRQTPNIQTLKWAVSIQTTVTEDVQYSIDKVHFQESNEFSGLNPSRYTAYARSKSDPDKLDRSDFILGVIVKELPTRSNIQSLLNQLSRKKDSKSFADLMSLFNEPSTISVVGAGGNISDFYSLMMDCQNGKVYSILNITISNNEITSIQVR